MKLFDRTVIWLCYSVCCYMFLSVSLNFTIFQTRNFAIGMLLYGLALILLSKLLRRSLRKAATNVVRNEFEKHPNMKDDLDLL